MRSLTSRRLPQLAAVLALLICTLPSPAQAQSRSSSELKAAIVLNILRFVDFPGNTKSTLDLCIESGVEASPQLRALTNQRVGNRPIRTRMISNGSFSGCEVAYLARSNPNTIRSAQNQGRLVMGDGPDFIDANGSVGLVETGGQVRFEINLGQASDNGLRISSRLVRLAARVRR
ncbi:YfiR family protein [Erythrobacter sp. SCSIO 43205]|uniref:YfiR family protein n=1 Tax=Erythrobacter sp. SCSIO 43205 TaxID=2779361 RepID=UPI001CA7FC78|nr:YfiR family protein [Erythrobacter sp. SCSIO 43205]UAB79356.1 YfiR family protein [Erythrobacter sp. SCSIO 43205]